MQFMQLIYTANDVEKRKLRYLYQSCGIEHRYSVLPDYSCSATDWEFYPATENLEPFPSLEQRQFVYSTEAPLLSVAAIKSCLQQVPDRKVSHLITVSCTGLSAPGLDLQIMEMLNFDSTIFRTSVNFMGCYAAIHALKIADAICKSDTAANVLVVCTELCTLHFQKEPTIDNITSSLLFGDGSAAVLVTGDPAAEGVELKSFYHEVIPSGRNAMAWELSSKGFLMTLSSYVPDLIEKDFSAVVERALNRSGACVEDIFNWCIHPGGKRILESVQRSNGIESADLEASYQVLRKYGNTSSASILFVLKELIDTGRTGNVFAAAFGPGLTVETFTACI